VEVIKVIGLYSTTAQSLTSIRGLRGVSAFWKWCGTDRAVRSLLNILVSLMAEVMTFMCHCQKPICHQTGKTGFIAQCIV